MIALVWRRVLSSLPLLLGVSFAAFLILHLSPGDPARLMLGENATPSAISALHRQLGLDQPLQVQFGLFVWNALHGNLGYSFRTYQPVAAELWLRAVATAELSAVAFGLSLLAGVPLGVLTALRRNSWVDYVLRVVTLVSLSTPVFWLGIVLIFVFAVKLHWVPSSGAGTPTAIILPGLALSTYTFGILFRMTRTAVTDVLHEDFLRTAYAKGLRRRTVIARHALRNAFIPILTVLGLQFGSLMSGAVVTETVFAWPGVGLYMVRGLFARDYPVIRGCILLFAVSFLLINLLVDILYGYLDPRLRYG